MWEVKRDHVRGKYFCTFWLQSKETINMSCYSCSIFSFYNGCCPYTQWSSKEDKCVGMFKAFFSFLFLILLHEYCYLNLTAFVVLTQTNTWLYNRPSCYHKLYLASISAYAECFYNIMRKYIKNTCNFDKFPTPILCYPL